MSIGKFYCNKEARTIVESKRATINQKISLGDTEGIKLGYCGKCYYDDDLKTFQEEYYYPYCSCICNEDKILTKCKNGEKDNHGETLEPGFYIDRLPTTFTICPVGYKVSRYSFYYTMIFEPPGDVNKYQEKVDDLINTYKNEIRRLDDLYLSPLCWIFGTSSKRDNKIFELESHITFMLLSIYNNDYKKNKELSKVLKANLELQKKDLEVLELKLCYKKLGFRSTDPLPTKDEVTVKYNNMLSLFNKSDDTYIYTNDLVLSYDKIMKTY